jgi:hypothetical protein
MEIDLSTLATFFHPDGAPERYFPWMGFLRSSSVSLSLNISNANPLKFRRAFDFLFTDALNLIHVSEGDASVSRGDLATFDRFTALLWSTLPSHDPSSSTSSEISHSARSGSAEPKPIKCRLRDVPDLTEPPRTASGRGKRNAAADK